MVERSRFAGCAGGRPRTRITSSTLAVEVEGVIRRGRLLSAEPFSLRRLPCRARVALCPGPFDASQADPMPSVRQASHCRSRNRAASQAAPRPQQAGGVAVGLTGITTAWPQPRPVPAARLGVPPQVGHPRQLRPSSNLCSRWKWFGVGGGRNHGAGVTQEHLALLGDRPANGRDAPSRRPLDAGGRFHREGRDSTWRSARRPAAYVGQ